jgi:dolichol-phosphate mannosyltransferase
MTIYILLPAYNEEDGLEPLMEKIASTMHEMGTAYRVVVVNDGSTDGTARILTELAERYPIDVITHKYNRGLGETARDGFEYIAEVASPDDIIVRMDGDDTHDPMYIPAMVAKLEEDYEVAIASRYAPGGGQTGVDWYRGTISRIANLLMKAVFPIPGVKEYSCGYRAYRVALIQDALDIFGNRFISLMGMGFTGTVEKIIKCKMMGARVAEVPFILRYDQKQSTSKVVTSITTLGYVALMAKYIIFWGDIGKEWKGRIEERKQRVYSPDGRLLESPMASHGPIRRTT